MKWNEVPDGEASSRISDPSFPEELIFLILSLIPADILYSCIRYVCKQWYNIIHSPAFMDQYRPSRVSGLFFAQDGFCLYKSLEKSAAAPTILNVTSEYRVWAACDGLLLLERRRDRTMFIANPLTRRITAIPPFRHKLHHHTLSLACARSAKEYKVVLTNLSVDQQDYECGVLTLGRDCAWKLIDSEELHGYLRNILGRTYCIGEFIFWVGTGASHILCLCVESETVFSLPSPTADDEGYSKTYLPGREFLSLLGGCEGGRYVDIWCLFDPKGSDGWRKMYKLDMGIQVDTSIRDLKIPVAWVNSEVVIFYKFLSTGPLLGHNVKTGEIIEIVEECNPLGSTFFSEFVCSFTWKALR